MKKLFVLILSFISLAYSQYYRLTSLGDLYIAVDDVDNSVNLYDFGKNPAWIVLDERSNRIWADFGFLSFLGGYKRLYEPGRLNCYKMSFGRVQNLGKSGVFKGYALYLIEERKDLYRSLLLYPYDGKAFFATDTTTGNFRYAGPEIGFNYGFELTKNVFIGIGLKYNLVDGLKDIYTRSRTIYRDVEGVLGLAFKVTDKVGVGFSMLFLDSQEKIEAKSEDLYDAEIYFFRGEQYSIKRRSNIIEFKLREKGYGGSAQLSFSLGSINTGVKIGYKQVGEKLLVPYGLIEEYEFGYSNFTDYGIEVISRAKLSDFLTLGFLAQYKHFDIWSKHSERNLLIWREKLYFAKYGCGVSFKVSEKLNLVGFEFTVDISGADSMKYIDNMFTELKAYGYCLKGGIEYVLSSDLILRFGLNYKFLDKDIIAGGDNVKYYKMSWGFEVFRRINLVFGFGRFKNGSVGFLKGKVRDEFIFSIITKLG